MAATQLTRLEARTRAIKGAGSLTFVVFCVALGFVVVATAVPQRKKLAELETKLRETESREKLVMAEREAWMTEHTALREDPEFLEMHARDRLAYYKEGERVLKFRR
ncbi:MAG: hypothetical protein QM627_09280 [Luteolibacter sp.]